MPLTTLVVSLALPFGAGISLYGVVLWVGVFRALGWVLELPGSLEGVTSPAVMVGAAALAAVEFFVDKRRGLDTLSDAVHVFVRGPGGALLAFLAVSDRGWEVQLVAALVGGALAFSTHSTKASIRFTANALRQPYVSLLLSLAEDVTVVGIVWLAFFLPVGALVVVGVGSVAMALYLPRVAVAFFLALQRTLNALLARTR